jgi:hypothetical protein
MRDTAPNLRRVHLADIIEGFVGGIAQLGERLHGMQEVSGSIPLTSTTNLNRRHDESGAIRSPVRLEA